MPTSFIEPRIDGRVSNYFEWFSAGHYDPLRGGDSMHQAETTTIKGLHFGFGREDLYLRVDLSGDVVARKNLAGGAADRLPVHP